MIVPGVRAITVTALWQPLRSAALSAARLTIVASRSRRSSSGARASTTTRLLPGMTLVAPGSRVIRPIVTTASSISGAASVIAM